MNFFKNTMTLDEVKETYRTLAKKFHPDFGGSVEQMSELNNQFEIAFKCAKRFVSESKETSTSFVRKFYTENGWEGSRYDSSLTTTDIAKKVREYAKFCYPDYKFSIRTKYFSGGSECNIGIKQIPFAITSMERCRKWCKNNLTMYGRTEFFNGEKWVYGEYTEEDFEGYVKYIFEKCSKNWVFNHHYDFGNDMEEKTPMDIRVLNAVKDVMNYLKSFNRNDSDSMVDYYDTNFYFDIYTDNVVVKEPKTLKLPNGNKKVA